MNEVNVPVGISTFSEIRKNNYYYVDKSAFIAELLKTKANEVTLFTRPRRFGKTLNMSMLSDFFDIRRDSRSLFEGLAISKDEALCDHWMNQWPTLFITLKSVNGLDFNDAYSMLRSVIAAIYIEHYYLKDSPAVNNMDKKAFLQLADTVDGCPTLSQIKNSLSLLMRMLHAHYKKPVVLLIDEYDVPLAKASEKNYYDEMLNVLRDMLGQALKDNPSLKFSVITGCLRIAKESIFTGTNNFVSDTISGERFNEYFGFTQEEVDQLLTGTNLTGHAASMKTWYDGYHFGDVDIYCPWDVMNHISALLLNPATPPHDYWKNTSDNAIIRSFIDRTDLDVTDKFESLLSGGYVVQNITENLTYDMLHSSEDNLWSVLYLTGYLTQKRRSELPEGGVHVSNAVALEIPNEEIRSIFQETILIWFQDKAKALDRSALFSAVWNADARQLTDEITKLLYQTISYYDYKEDFYHAFLAGIFTGAGYAVDSNKEYGEGRSDIAVKNTRKSRIAIFEIKHSNSRQSLQKDGEAALKQIEDRQYAHQLADDYETVICYGISFYKKQCLALVH